MALLGHRILTKLTTINEIFGQIMQAKHILGKECKQYGGLGGPLHVFNFKVKIFIFIFLIQMISKSKTKKK